jgi:lambda family phage portal protein
VQPGEAGEFVVAPQGYTLNSWSPDYPHQNFDAFIKACWYSIAAGLDVAAHNLTGDLSAVNYSSARVGELAERDVWKTLQGWWIHSFCMPVYRDWLGMAILRGEIRFPSGSALGVDKFQKFEQAANFLGRRWAWVDPQKDVAAAQAALDARLTSRRRLVAEQGEDFEEIVDDLASEEEYMEAAGIAVSPEAAAASAAAETAEEAAAGQTTPPAAVSELEASRSQPGTAGGDVNGDGTTNAADMAALLNAWTG